MSKVKNEHIVSQCYLRNFTFGEDKINVFDKIKLEIRRNQAIGNVAAEKDFYEPKLLSGFEDCSKKQKREIRKELKRFTKHRRVEDLLEEIDKDQVVENKYLASFEGTLSSLLRDIILRADKSSIWFRKNCYAITEDEKKSLSLSIALQALRTRNFRDNSAEAIRQFYLELIRIKSHENSDSCPEQFDVEVNNDFVRLNQLSMLLDPEVVGSFTEVFNSHIWILKINETDVPFTTSDNPVVTIPHKKDDFVSYGGYASEAVEICYPISSRYLINMFEAKANNQFSYIDRRYSVIDSVAEVRRLNRAQIVNCHRCIFSESDDFSQEIALCQEHPMIQSSKHQIEIVRPPSK